MSFKLLFALQILVGTIIAIALGAWITWVGVVYGVLSAMGIALGWPYIRDSGAMYDKLRAEMHSDTSHVDFCDAATFERVNHLEEPIWMKTDNLKEYK